MSLACEASSNRRGGWSAEKVLELPNRVPGTSEKNAYLGTGLFPDLSLHLE
jgi:hypothetical protein